MRSKYFAEIATNIARGNLLAGMITREDILAALIRRFASDDELRAFVRTCEELAELIMQESKLKCALVGPIVGRMQ